MATRRNEQLERAEAAVDRTALNPVVLADTAAERDRIMAQRAARSELDLRYGLLAVPHDDPSIQAWEARQTNREERS